MAQPGMLVKETRTSNATKAAFNVLLEGLSKTFWLVGEFRKRRRWVIWFCDETKVVRRDGVEIHPMPQRKKIKKSQE